MSYTFTQIERDKSSIIGIVFFFLLVFYIVAVTTLVFLIKSFLLSYAQDKIILDFSYFSLIELFPWIVLGITIGILHFVISMHNMASQTLKWLEASYPDPKNNIHQTFVNIIEEIQIATGHMELKGMVIPSQSLNAFTVDDESKISVIGVTEGALLKLTRDQLAAVVAHQAGHILKGDSFKTTLTSSIFELYTIPMRKNLHEQKYKLSSGWFGSGSSSDDNSSGGFYSGSSSENLVQFIRFSAKLPIIIFFIVIIFLLYCVTTFISTILRMLISRESKLRADAIAVRLTRNPLSLSQAILLLGNNWRGEGTYWASLEGLFFVNPHESWLDERIGIVADIFSTHPPMMKRVSILLEMIRVKQEDLFESIRPQLSKSVIAPEIDSKDNQLSKITLTPVIHRTALLCPVCTAELKYILYENEKISCCESCKGYFINEDQASAIMFRKLVSINEEVRLRASNYMNQIKNVYLSEINQVSKQNAYVCPKCYKTNRKMQTRLFNYIYPLVIDKCVSCNYMWFDQFELEILQALYEQRNPNQQF